MTSRRRDMTFMRLREILAAILDLCKLYLFAHLRSLVCYSRDLILTFCGIGNFLAVRLLVDPVWGLDFLAY